MEKNNQDLYIAGVFKQLSELSTSLKSQYGMALGRAQMLGNLCKAFDREKFTTMASEGLDNILNSTASVRRSADASLQKINTYIDELLRDALRGEEHKWYKVIGDPSEITLTDMGFVLEEGLVSDIYDFSRYYVDALDGVTLFDIVFTYDEQIRTLLNHLLERSRSGIADNLAFEIVVRLVVLTFDSNPEGVELEERSPGRAFEEYMMTCLHEVIDTESLKTIDRSYSNAAFMWRELVMSIQTFRRPSGYIMLDELWNYVHVIGRRAVTELRRMVMFLVPPHLHLPVEVLDMIQQYSLEPEGIPSEYASSMNPHYGTIEYYNAYIKSHPRKFQNPRTPRLQKRRRLPDILTNLD